MNQINGRRTRSGWLMLALIEFAVILMLGLVFYFQNQDEALVVYCAHDSVFSEKILKQFEQQTGIKVEPRFDTEATKSLGLTNLIIREKDHPQCDVFWNNQALGTAALKDQGLLESYQGPGYDRIPAAFKDPDGCWTGFAARLRVYIANTESYSLTYENVETTLAGQLNQVAIAKPLYGTTLSHFAILCDAWGLDRLQEWYHSLQERGIQVTSGNSSVKNLVASGACILGYTDTDDYFVAVDAGQPVSALPVLVEEKALLIPNSVAIIKGTKRRKQAEALVDYLLSAEVELELSQSQSRQIPLGTVNWDLVPDDVQKYRPYIQQAYPLSDLVQQRKLTLDWLKSEYLK
ncbi:extracellular solute-binding protein [Gimesia sp.]|uniref:extracellular solute-binding protein n=1 Tax=Gimesia sp. TaxID=2024833 RepID=UPI000C3C3D20|nr:extracellular solute-binding protein [Gimesia sp.]MAX36539.1 ABC transporter substrate-binding protein [Gimesia sp.]HAH49606.1 ABC transporter substrate-binding protein [Planctomycetaceae bacterium]HBL47240.1 ABC transporter substrate-binding protein [Planctomycetaceae bacterium]|tara:strand:+ start:62635 stop:63678 length:1044 start_codon:yes stop_codon:yes gene_type:complete